MEHMTLYRIVYTCLYTCLMSHVCRVSYTPVRFTRGYNSTVYAIPRPGDATRRAVPSRGGSSRMSRVLIKEKGGVCPLKYRVGGKTCHLYIVTLFFDPPLP